MLALVILVLSIHVVSAVFWAGTSLVLARTGAYGGERLFRPQMGSAAIAVVFGAVLWGLLHRGGMGGMERVLAAGAVSAIAAAGVQGAMSGPAIRRMKADRADAAARGRFVMGQRIAGVLLAIALICMVTARYAG